MTEKRLIDAKAFAEHLERMARTAYPNLLPGTFEAVEYAKDFPTVDAVEVVRCKACKHWHQHNGKDSGKPVGYGDCKNPCGFNGIAYEDSFCSYGERKDGEGNG